MGGGESHTHSYIPKMEHREMCKNTWQTSKKNPIQKRNDWEECMKGHNPVKNAPYIHTDILKRACEY